jgi:glycosyltransferase involved in cell wall biosynthesis
MKLIIQIPSYNEERTLPDVVRGIPRHIVGVERVEILVIDDGSDDNTSAIARQAGVDHIVRHKNNKGLARAFATGLDTCVALGADIIVNIDADKQYDPSDIPLLIRPILMGQADIVIGDRQPELVEHFSRTKRQLQSIGSSVVKSLSGTDVPDAVSGFRAISRDAAIKLNIVSSFSYTTEMVIQAGRKNLAVTSVPIRTNPPTRPSRLFRSTSQFIARSMATMVRTFAMYKPLRTFVFIGTVLFVVGALPILRFVYFWMSGSGQGHVQSLILGGVFVILGCVTLLVALVADLIGFNRQLIELTLEKVRGMEREMRSHVSEGNSYEGQGREGVAAAQSRQAHAGSRVTKRVV